MTAEHERRENETAVHVLEVVQEIARRVHQNPKPKRDRVHAYCPPELKYERTA